MSLARSSIRCFPGALLTFALTLFAEVSPTQDRPGVLIETQVHGPSLEGNTLGAPAARTVHVYTSPAYEGDPGRRYPVLYLLHGIGDHSSVWVTPHGGEHAGYASIQALMDREIRDHGWTPMIVVMPDANAPDLGFFHTDSPVQGNWEQFISRDLVGYADGAYRTIPDALHRGILGHSMRGHGAIRLAMLHPDVWSAACGLNPALVGWGEDLSARNPVFSDPDLVRDPAGPAGKHPYICAVIGVGQALAPNPSKPPFLREFLFAEEGGQLVFPPAVHAEWDNDMLLSLAPKHVENLKRLRGLRFDSAFVDEYAHIPPHPVSFRSCSRSWVSLTSSRCTTGTTGTACGDSTGDSTPRSFRISRNSWGRSERASPSPGQTTFHLYGIRTHH